MGKLSEWLQVAANIGILAGLVLVGYQIKQSNDLQRIEQVSRSLELDMAHVMAQMGDDPAEAVAKAVFEPNEMTPKDRIVFTGFIYYMQMLALRTAELERQGLFDDEWRRITLPRIAFIMGGNPTSRAWWEATKQQYPQDSEWVIDLERMIEEIPQDLHRQVWGGIYEESLSDPN